MPQEGLPGRSCRVRRGAASSSVPRAHVALGERGVRRSGARPVRPVGARCRHRARFDAHGRFRRTHPDVPPADREGRADGYDLRHDDAGSGLRMAGLGESAARRCGDGVCAGGGQCAGGGACAAARRRRLSAAVAACRTGQCAGRPGRTGLTGHAVNQALPHGPWAPFLGAPRFPARPGRHRLVCRPRAGGRYGPRVGPLVRP